MDSAVLDWLRSPRQLLLGLKIDQNNNKDDGKGGDIAQWLAREPKCSLLGVRG